MDETIYERMGRRYIGDPKSIGLPDTVYSAALEFEPEELTQKVLKKRYLMSAALGDKFDLIATTVTKQVSLLFNVVGLVLLLLSVVMLVTHFGSMGSTAMQTVAGAVGQRTGMQQQAMDPTQQLLQQIQNQMQNR